MTSKISSNLPSGDDIKEGCFPISLRAAQIVPLSPERLQQMKLIWPAPKPPTATEAQFSGVQNFSANIYIIKIVLQNLRNWQRWESCENVISDRTLFWSDIWIRSSIQFLEEQMKRWSKDTSTLIPSKQQSQDKILSYQSSSIQHFSKIVLLTFYVKVEI